MCKWPLDRLTEYAVKVTKGFHLRHLRAKIMFKNSSLLKINISKILYSIRPFSQSSSEWLNRHNKDQYVKKAKIVIILFNKARL